MALEQLSSKITNTTGSLKMIEEQMSLQYKGIDAVREGQFEARERLLHDMEMQIKEKAETAEVDNFKVKGMLSHMEQVVSNLRNHSGEERERLRLEHRRLESMQANLESERRLMNERFTSELEQLNRKMALAEEMAEKDVITRREQTAEIAEMRRRLETEKKEFAVYVSTSVKTAERTSQHLKEEESRLLALRSEVSQEQAYLNQQKNEAEEQLKQAAAWKRSVQKTRHELQLEKEGLEDLAYELQRMSDVLVDKDASFSRREQELEEREEKIADEKRAIDSAYGILQSKEKEIAQFNMNADQQRMAMKELEDEMLERRIAISARQRELVKVQQSEASQRLNMALSSLQSITNGTVVHTKNSEFSGKENIAALSSPPVKGYTTNQFEPPKVSPINVNAGGSEFNTPKFNEEIASAQRAIQKARGGVAKISYSNNQRQIFLRDESSFLSKIQSRQK